METEASGITEARRLWIWALAQALRSHGYAVEVAESGPLLAVPAAFGSPVVVRCDHRPMGSRPSSGVVTWVLAAWRLVGRRCELFAVIRVCGVAMCLGWGLE